MSDPNISEEVKKEAERKYRQEFGGGFFDYDRDREQGPKIDLRLWGCLYENAEPRKYGIKVMFS